jgi:pyruvate/2-oxoglutarate dehydrogenase complex dihydrolipoamide acyltransferase (E2) component
MLMDERQQKQVNEAAEKFANAIKGSYQLLATRSVSAQELNAQLTRDFFNRVIDNLRTQAEDTRQMAQQLADQQQRAQEATRTLTQESIDAYVDFLHSFVSFHYPPKERRSTAPAATDAALRWAEELGIDLRSVKGTGSGGRITVDDVRERWAKETGLDLSSVKATGVGGRITVGDLKEAAQQRHER